MAAGFVVRRAIVVPVIVALVIVGFVLESPGPVQVLAEMFHRIVGNAVDDAADMVVDVYTAVGVDTEVDVESAVGVDTAVGVGSAVGVDTAVEFWAGIVAVYMFAADNFVGDVVVGGVFEPPAVGCGIHFADERLHSEVVDRNCHRSPVHRSEPNRCYLIWHMYTLQ